MLGRVAGRAIRHTGALRTLVQSQKQTQTFSAVQPFVRSCSSSRFLSLADDDDEEKRKRRNDDDEDEQDGDVEASADGAESDASSEPLDKDGELALEDEMYKFCVKETEELDSEMMALFMSDPAKWTPFNLARHYSLTLDRVEATLFLQAEEAGLTPEQFKAQVEEAKAKVLVTTKETEEAIAAAQARGDEKEVKRLQKRIRQQTRSSEEEGEGEKEDEEDLKEEKQAILGRSEEAFRNPDFFFLSDEFEGYPPLTRRMGKQKFTDKLYPEEAIEIQRLASIKQNIKELPSFAKPTSVKNRWKMSVKDFSKNKLPLLIRDHDRTLRMATKEEVLPRSWVRRPPFFQGLKL